jgi:hypothetical protein
MSFVLYHVNEKDMSFFICVNIMKILSIEFEYWLFQYASYIKFHIIKEFVSIQTSHNSTKLVFILYYVFLNFLVKMHN